MNDIRVKDLSRAETVDNNYGLGLFTLGYEPRYTFLANILDRSNIKDVIVFSYSESNTGDSHIANKAVFEKLGYASHIDHSNVLDVYKAITNKIEIINISDEPLKILIDYFSMSRNWYAAALNYFLNCYPHIVEIIMVYSCAEYPLNDGFLSFELGDIRVLPGCQGASITKKLKAGIFMLGFDRIGPLSFYNLLEPDIAYGVISSPGSMPNYEEKAKNINSQFIQHHLKDGENLIGAPIFSVSQTFDNLCQLIQPMKEKYNVSIVQFGPKPHILASTLAGLTFRNVSCIYSEYQRTTSHSVKASGELVLTSIIKKSTTQVE